MKRKETLNKDQLNKRMMSFFINWYPEAWAYKDSPGYQEARELRLQVQRRKRLDKVNKNGP